MKKLIFSAAILSVLLVGCKDSKTTEVETTTQTELIQAPEAAEAQKNAMENQDMALDNSWINDIELKNNNERWEANKETTEGVKKMSSIVKKSDPKTVEDYHQLASELNEEKNTVVKKCTMEGASHDNLHIFLHPLIEKINALGKVESVEKGAEITANIEENLREYDNYFE